MAREDVFASSDVLDELLPWGLGRWLPALPPYASFCDPKAVAVPLGQLLRILLDERPWAQHLNDMDAADAVRSWLRGVLRDLATRRRVSKAWAAAGQRCFDALVAELRRRGAAHARAAQAFLDASPEVYPGELPPGSWIDSKREIIVRPWSQDAEGAKHVPLLQALFENYFHHHALALMPLDFQPQVSENVYFKHSVCPRQWVTDCAALAVPINERQLWDTLHRRCRCCPRSSPCCLHVDQEQVQLRDGGDGCGSDHRRLVQLGPWPETKARGLARVGRSALPSYIAYTTGPVTTVSNPVRETANGMPCMRCNPCDRVVLPYTHNRHVVTVCIRSARTPEDLRCNVDFERRKGPSTSGERLMNMMIQGGCEVRHSKWNAAIRSLYRRRELVLLAARGPRAPCTCEDYFCDVSRSMLSISLPLFHVEDGVDNSWASVLGLDRAGLFQEAVQWPRLQHDRPLIVDNWRCLELDRRLALLDESLPGKYDCDVSIMFRAADKRMISPACVIHGTTDRMKPGFRHRARFNLEHLQMYAPLRPLLEKVDADEAKAKELGVAAATRYSDCFGDDEAMVKYFQRVECLLGQAWARLEKRAATPPGDALRFYQEEHELAPRRAALRRIARAYIDANHDSPPMSGSQRLQAVANVPANSPTHPELLLRWYLAAICGQEKPSENDVVLSLVRVAWKPLPPQSEEDSPPETFSEAELVVHLSFWAPSAPTVPKHMRFGFAVRMRDFDRLCCATLSLAGGGDAQAQPLSMRAWWRHAAGLAEEVTRHVRVCDLRRLRLLETVLGLPWVPVFPLVRTLHERSTDAPEGTLGMRALKGLCHMRDGWLGRLHPKKN